MHAGTPLIPLSLRRSVLATLLLLTGVCACAATPVQDAAAPSVPGAPVQAALDDAARVTGQAAARIKVTLVERVTWRDGALGCPEPDLLYPQMLMPGYRIRLEAGGKALDYHADQRGTVLLCPPERAQASLPAPPAH
jgi:hypothetical protein